MFTEHCNMIRGLVPSDKLLEWAPEDGWAPLCEFLGRPIPKSNFPYANAAGSGWKDREQQCLDTWAKGACVNFLVFLAILASAFAYVYCTYG